MLVDANILLRLIQIGHPHQQPALDAITQLRLRDREEFAVCPQVIYEMYAVCTRPITGPYPGLGLSCVSAMAQVDKTLRQFTLEPESAGVFRHWRELVVRYGVSGKSSHDARLAALMIEQRIPKLLTFNDAHFARYAEIAAVNPFDVLGIPRV